RLGARVPPVVTVRGPAHRHGVGGDRQAAVRIGLPTRHSCRDDRRAARRQRDSRRNQPPTCSTRTDRADHPYGCPGGAWPRSTSESPKPRCATEGGPPCLMTPSSRLQETNSSTAAEIPSSSRASVSAAG